MKKKLRVGILVTLAILLLAGGLFAIYVSDYYEADESVQTLLLREDIEEDDDYVILSNGSSSDEAPIFYPGRKVEYTAYLPILEQVHERTDLTIILVRMPFNLAVFDSNKADTIMAEFPSIKTWHIAGHSLGGAMASRYAADNPEIIGSLILLGAYNYGGYSPDDTLTIYGSLEESVADQIDYSQNVIVIEGGNHAQFGDYGEQDGDPVAEISREQQQSQAVDAIAEFFN